MSKKECDIIKDLLPSYVDEICSEASKVWVEEHLAECEECRASAGVMKNTEISAKRLEQESLDAGRKVIRQNLRRSIFSFGLSLLMGLLLVVSFFWDNGQIPILMLPVCMAMTWLVSRNQTKKRAWDKWDGIALAVAVVSAGYGVAFMFYSFLQVTKGATVFGLEVAKIGPFLNNQMVAVTVLCFGLYLVQIVRTIKQGRMGSVVTNVCLTGMFLMLSYCVLMRQLLDVHMAWMSLQTITWVTLAIGTVGIIIFAIIDKLGKNNLN